MKRDTLRRYLASLVLAALPGCCSGDPSKITQGSSHVDAGTLQAIDGGVTEGAQLPPELCKQLCHGNTLCEAKQLDAGQPEVDCISYEYERCPAFGAGGRPPAGLRPVAPVHCDDPLGAYFAHMAHVEGAAVFGFQQLARELKDLGAPNDLIAAARDAAEDERRHERIARRLARDYGATPAAIVVDPSPPRSALEIALNNATEGGVFETFAVLVTEWQSHTAADRRVRAAFARIAEDEMRHAELAEAVGRWLEPRLTTEERASVDQARRDAAAQLARQMNSPFDPKLISLGGLPKPELARAWVANMTERLWS